MSKLISKDQYRKILLKQIEENKQRRFKQKQERMRSDADEVPSPTFKSNNSRANSRKERSSITKHKRVDSNIPISPRIFNNNFSIFHKRSQSQLEPNRSHDFGKTSRVGRNLLHWQNIDQETIEENENKKKVMKEWLTSQINQNKMRRIKVKEKQKAEKPKLQQIFKLGEQKAEKPRVKRKLIANYLVQQKQPQFEKENRGSSEGRFEGNIRNKTQMTEEIPFYSPKRKQERMNTISQMEDISQSKFAFEIEGKISNIKRELEEQKQKHSLQIQQVRAEAFKFKKEKENLELQFHKLKKFVERKLVKKQKPVSQAKQMQNINEFQYTFRQSAPKSNFFNESILNSSKQISFYETQHVPIQKQNSSKKRSSNNIFNSTQSLSHLELSSSIHSAHKTHLTKSQYIDKY